MSEIETKERKKGGRERREGTKANKTIETGKQRKETDGKSGLRFMCLVIISLVNFLLHLDALLILFI